MKKLAIGVAVVFVGIFVLAQIQLSGLSDSDRAMLSKIGTTEVLRLLRVLPRESHQNASFGRRSFPGRGHAPWVVRGNLDGETRRIQLALAPEVWLSYDTELAVPRQFWRGELIFQGPVYNTYHGQQPVSRGRAWFRHEQARWWLAIDGETESAEVQYLGHVEQDGGASIRLRYRLRALGVEVLVEETPELMRDGARYGLRRDFVVSSTATAVTALLRNGQDDPSLTLTPGADQVEHWFDEPTLSLDPPDDDALQYTTPLAQRLMEVSDCASCHNGTQTTVGPSWRDIALRYAGEERQAAAAMLGTRIIEGSSGVWGQAVMTPHPTLGQRDAERLAAHVLAFSSDAVELPEDPFGGRYEMTFDYEVEPRLSAPHPSYSLERIRPDGFRPMVGGMAWDANGRLLLATWDEDGSVYRLSGLDDPASVRIERIAEGLQEPLGLRAVGERLFVLQKQELTELIDHDEDGRIDEYRTHNNRWGATANFHEFAFGLVHQGDHLYGAISVCVLNGGASCPEQDPDRGSIVRFHLESGEMETVATGLRTPNGLGSGPDAQLFVTDNQGDWLPASKLQPVDPGDFYGWRPPGTDTDRKVRPAALLLPQDEIGNSPTEPVFMSEGLFSGQMLFGDVYQGGIQRAFLERVNGVWQGAAFRFSGGLEGASNRLLLGPGGAIYVGEIGNPGNWGDPGKNWYGLERLTPNGVSTFELLEVRARAGGFELTMSEAIAHDIELEPADLKVRQWFYHATANYGGPKMDDRVLNVRAIEISGDRRRLTVEIDGLEAHHMVYLRLDPRIVSTTGQAAWVREAWYTLNELVQPN
jgi:cytochrome c